MAHRGDEILKNLLKHCPDKTPLSHTLYAGLRLKDQLESVRNNWFPKAKKAAVHLTPAQKKAFKTSLPWISSYLEGIRALRKKRSLVAHKAWNSRRLIAATAALSTAPRKGYTSAGFSDDHENFKNVTSKVFAGHLKKRRSLQKTNWIVLDDFSRDNRQELRTLAVMKRAGLQVQDHAFFCNPGLQQIRSAQQLGVRSAAQMLCNDALRTVWKKETFGAAYLDLCAGSVEVIMSVLTAVMERSSRAFVVGVTITGRDQRGRKMSRRLKSIRETVRRRFGLRPLPVAKTTKSNMMKYRGNSVVTLYFNR